jgi:hypothetical protein
MHLYVHFDELVSCEIKQYLLKEFTLLSQSQPLWHTWGMTSFMMGISFVVIGLLNSIFFMGLPKKVPPSIGLLLIGLLYYLAVLYAGMEFQQSFQLYGGFICSNLLICALIFTVFVKKRLIPDE